MKTKLIIGLLLVLSCCSSCTEDDKAPTYVRPVNYTVDFSNVTVDKFTGFGTQYNNNLYTSRTYTSDGVTAVNLPDLEKKVKDLKSRYVRIFFDRKCWQGQSGYDAEYMPSFIKVVELAQATGSLVNITYWNTSAAAQMPDFGDVIYDLIVTRGLTCVKQITIQNEVSDTQITQPDYQASYRALDAKLIALGIRDKVDFVGGDLTQTAQDSWFRYMATNMGDILQGYSSHIYWDYPAQPTKGVERLDGINDIVNSLGAGKRPVYITEYGVRGVKKGGTDPYDNPGYLQNQPISWTNAYAKEHAIFNINALNRGFSGLIKWDCYKAKYDNGSQYHSLIGPGSEGYPLYPAYHMQRLFNLTSESGWKVVKVSAGDDIFKYLAAMKSNTTSDITLYAGNSSNGDIYFRIAGLPANTDFHTLVWNFKQQGELTRGDDLRSDANGEVTLVVGAIGVAALTTLDIEI